MGVFSYCKENTPIIFNLQYVMVLTKDSIVVKTNLTLIAMLFLFSTLFAEGGLALMDHSIIFEGNSRKELTKFVNRGSDTISYSISLISLKMDKNGEMVENSDSLSPYEAIPYLRIYPRTVTLPPNVLQSVAVQLRRSSDMEPGEYRSHLFFNPIPNDENSDLSSGTSGTPEKNTASAEVKFNTSISIPVLILVEDLIVTGSMSKLEIVDGKVVIGIERSGNRSLRSILDFEHILEVGESTPIRSQSAVLYREVNRLEKSFNLGDLSTKPGKLKVTLKIKDDKDGYIILDTKEVSLEK
jgi:hypothetical protein